MSLKEFNLALSLVREIKKRKGEDIALKVLLSLGIRARKEDIARI